MLLCYVPTHTPWHRRVSCWFVASLLSWAVWNWTKCVFCPAPLCSVSQANLDESQMSSSPFLRALMTAVCKAAVKGKHSTTWRRHSALLKSQRWLQYLHSAKRGAERLTVHSLCLLLYWTDDNTNCRVDTAIIQRRLPVLLKYLNSDTERQLQALYALQALIVALDQPPSRFNHNDTMRFSFFLLSEKIGLMFSSGFDI